MRGRQEGVAPVLLDNLDERLDLHLVEAVELAAAAAPRRAGGGEAVHAGVEDAEQPRLRGLRRELAEAFEGGGAGGARVYGGGDAAPDADLVRRLAQGRAVFVAAADAAGSGGVGRGGVGWGGWGVTSGRARPPAPE